MLESIPTNKMIKNQVDLDLVDQIDRNHDFRI
jgi:hypothetical protein